jgi:hypothetical protein
LKDWVEKWEAAVGTRRVGSVGGEINPLEQDLGIEAASARMKGLGSMKWQDKKRTGRGAPDV